MLRATLIGVLAATIVLVVPPRPRRPGRRHGIVIEAEPGDRGSSPRAIVHIAGPTASVAYGVDANLADEGIHFFATGEYVGTVAIRGGNGFTTATARRIPWCPKWYGNRFGCPVGISEGVEQREAVGRIEVTHEAGVTGGPKTITVGPGFRTAEVSPPSPFSGSARFERTEGAKGTWLGDLRATFHSGFRVVHEGP